MTHWRIAGVEDFVVHAKHEDALEVFGHQRIERLLAMQIDMLDSTAFRGIVIGGDIWGTDDTDAIFLRILAWDSTNESFK